MTAGTEQVAPARLAPSPPRRAGRWGGAALIAVAVAWSLSGTGVDPAAVISGREGAARLVAALLQPDLSADFLPVVAAAALETLQMSVAALVLALVAGLPLAVLQARNVAAPDWVRTPARLIATVLRGIPELLWALVLVAAVGLGPAAGVYAIALHGAGLLGKLFAEQLEAVDAGPVEALQLVGSPRRVVALFGILPQARTGLVSLALYQWECNIRTATVVGFVGGGGIGQALDIAMRLFRYGEMATLVLTVLALILAVDGISRVVRRRVGAAA